MVKNKIYLNINAAKYLLLQHFFYFFFKERNFMVTKILVFMLFLAIINTIKESTLFSIAMKREVKFEISNNRLLMIGISIAYILTIIFTGISI